jgi:hypothetical protein
MFRLVVRYAAWKCWGKFPITSRLFVPIDPVEPRIAMFFGVLMSSEKGKQIHVAMQPTQMRYRTNLERSTITAVLEEETKGSFDYGGVF